MLDSFTYSTLPDEDQVVAPRCNPAYRKMVHAFAGKAKLPLLKREEERELIGLVQDEGSQEAMQQLVESHMGFIMNIVDSAIKTPQVEEFREDLVSEGVTGFMAGVRKFNLKESRARLSTLTKYYVVASVLDYIKNNIYPFRFGTNLADRAAFYQLHKVRAQFEKIHGRPMQLADTDLRLAREFTTLSVKAMTRAWMADVAKNPVDVQAIQVHDSRSAKQPEAQVAEHRGYAAVNHRLSAFLAGLGPRERDILSRVLASYEDRTSLMHQIADDHDLTVERIRQIVRGGLADIRAMLAHDGLTKVSDVI